MHQLADVPRDETILAEAGRIMVERGADYGPPSDHHVRTAQAVNAILGTDLSARDVAVFFVVDKLVRSRTSPTKRDHYVDIAGYTEIAYGHAKAGR